MISKSVVVIGMYLVKIRKTVCFEHNVQEFVVLYFGHLLVYQNSFDRFLSGGSTDAKFRANRSNYLGGVLKSTFHVIRTHQYGDMNHFLLGTKSAGSCYLITWVLFGLSKFKSNSRNVANLLFPTPPRQFHWFAQNFANIICGLSWQKKLLKEFWYSRQYSSYEMNFLYILLKTQSVFTLVCLNDMKPRWLLPYEPLKRCDKNYKLTFSNSSLAIWQICK